MKHYDQIIIGGGAAGLYYAALCPVKNGLLLEKTSSPGRKLLLSGSGQCNLTHGGSIKEYISHYGDHGKKIRTALYRANNLQLMEFWESHGIPLVEREDGKVFPRSLRAYEIQETLLHLAKDNGWHIRCDSPVTELSAVPLSSSCAAASENSAQNNDKPRLFRYEINHAYTTNRLIIATGGCSFPDTGSDGSIFPLLKQLGLHVTELKPSLSPITVQEYPYADLSGISFPQASVSLHGHKRSDGLLLTHTGFSGPAILNLSRYGNPGDTLTICYAASERAADPQCCFDAARSNNSRSTLHWLTETYDLPKRFAEILLQRIGTEPTKKAASLSGKQLNKIHSMVTNDTFSISGTGSFRTAMATNGGVALSQIDPKTFAVKGFPGLSVIGEALDVDGDTGGYNLQFAFSSAFCAAQAQE